MQSDKLLIERFHLHNWVVIHQNVCRISRELFAGIALFVKKTMNRFEQKMEKIPCSNQSTNQLLHLQLNEEYLTKLIRVMHEQSILANLILSMQK